MQGIEISENDGILEIKLPCLLPKRRQRQSTEFLLDPFTSALSDYAAHHTMPQFQHCVVCFSHIYAQELPERRIRDYDNLELKQFLDVAASFILTDDNGLLCDAYNTTELGEEDCTRLFLMDSTQFPAWLAERQNGVKAYRIFDLFRALIFLGTKSALKALKILRFFKALQPQNYPSYKALR